MRKFMFLQDATPEDWNPLPRKFKAGETIFKFSGCDYGCVSDDAKCGYETIACCEVEGKNPFFTVPVTMLTDEKGKSPRGSYLINLINRK